MLVRHPLMRPLLHACIKQLPSRIRLASFSTLGDPSSASDAPPGSILFFQNLLSPATSTDLLPHDNNKKTLPQDGQEQLQFFAKRYFLQSTVNYFRTHGHLAAHLDPLDLSPRATIWRHAIIEGFPSFVKENMKLEIKDLLYGMDKKKSSLTDLIEHLEDSYTKYIGYEFMHIEDSYERDWFASHAEANQAKLTIEEQNRIARLLIQSETFDEYLSKKFPQLKRYGLDGSEGMMVAMDELLNSSLAEESPVADVVIAMPHRGRLNLLTGLLEMKPRLIFHKIKGGNELPSYSETEYCGTGDVLSHLGQSVDIESGNRKIHCSLLNNPSHLEAVNPVALGKIRCKLDEHASSTGTFSPNRVLSIQLHGDGAFAGQGIVPESLQMALLPGYSIGGTIHIIVNNQLSFTCDAKNARSTRYPSDVAKMLGCPIIHVNGHSMEAIKRATSIAFKYRQKFGKDIVIDLIAYRSNGHNELDEPAFTQPLMYQRIRGLGNTSALVIAEAHKRENIKQQYLSYLEEEFEASKSYEPENGLSIGGKWGEMTFNQSEPQATGVDPVFLKKVAKASVCYDKKTFSIHPRLEKHHVEARLEALKNETFDWAAAEAMAIGSLLKLEKVSVRLAGQDVSRGTFSHRHMSLVDQKSEKIIIPLNQPFEEDDGKLYLVNSYLSELAALGFEYGYSWESPNNLVIWEAQFGDFINGAQIILDTFISSGEDKWLRQSGLVLTLPHGYDGAGPEHSSARIERFLQMTNEPLLKEDGSNQPTNYHPNMHVVYPTTPAQYFHLLRRQITRNFRKPLIVIAPKTLLRHPQAMSHINEMSPGTRFLPVLDDTQCQNKESQVEKILIVSGKLYYDLFKERSSRNQESSVAIIRIEQLAPFPWKALSDAISKYQNVSRVIYVQEEPRNMGAFSFVSPRLPQILPNGVSLEYIGRKELAAPAVGVSLVYKQEQEDIIKLPFL